MRIAFAAHTAGRAGGAESYLATVVPALNAAGHEVACWFETADPAREPILGPKHGIPAWTAGDRHADALASLQAWAPDVLYVHGITSPCRERELLMLAPSVCFAHSYYGTCISGSKMHRLPGQRTCTHTFGYECLAQYYPRRCGGLNPVTMLRRFRLQQSRFELLASYSRIVVASHHMAEEYARHGFGSKVRVLPLPVEGPVAQRKCAVNPGSWRLLYLGRFEPTKGTLMALESASILASHGRRVSLQISGDGSLSEPLRKRARLLMEAQPNLSVTITGWLSADECVRAFDQADLLLLPSAWPEPFGLVGVEAGLRGLPSVAFAVGGIHEWLQDGVNGRIIPPAPSDAKRFATAIASCLTDPTTLDRMRTQSRLAAARFSVATHLKKLEAVLSDAVLGAPANQCEAAP